MIHIFLLFLAIQKLFAQNVEVPYPCPQASNPAVEQIKLLKEALTPECGLSGTVFERLEDCKSKSTKNYKLISQKIVNGKVFSIFLDEKINFAARSYQKYSTSRDLVNSDFLMFLS